ncbi:BatD family protein [Methylosinus sp. H3A]|uniref:BatD family protein n=1 Tax=Methylosinus sp. H3A TaxID=2785786 RepID=UPI0018C2ABDE|nr:BatD family protein [Methylosinus sp. H3A]MBG0810549.1 BatD family protein [Methylosinus sp. H3A]
MLLRLALVLCLALCSFARVAAQENDAPVGRVEIRVELPAETPYVGEPLRLVLRSAIRGRILLDHIIQPSLVDFDWQQFGVDSSSEEMIDGFWTPVVERVLMIYPLRAGRLTIPPFTRRIAYRIEESGKVEAEYASAPFEIEVRARDGLAPPGESFLPAKSLRISDAWEPEPDKIPFGETARRTVTVEAEGVTADRLPPLPNFRAPGIITFAAPVERRTIVTDQGPIARAVYRWSVRPVSSISAFAPPIRIAWFDIATRRMREAVAPERRVAFIEAARERAAARLRESHGLLAPQPLIAALASFVATAALVFLLAAASSERRLARRPAALGALRRAARAGDAAAFRRAASQLAQADRAGWRAVVTREDIGAQLAALDAFLYGRDSAASPPALAPLGRAIAAGWARRGEELRGRG